MVRKVISIIVICLALTGAICAQAQAETHSVYSEGTLSNTYVTYFKDIVSGIGFDDNYVGFRSGQYTYTLIVGDIDYSNNIFTATNCKEYVFETSSGYSSQYKYYVNDLTEFSLSATDTIIYSDMGNYPQLVERGAKYEILTMFIICICCLCVVINRIFFKC